MSNKGKLHDEWALAVSPKIYRESVATVTNLTARYLPREKKLTRDRSLKDF